MYDQDTRSRAFELLDDGYSARQVADRLGCAASTDAAENGMRSMLTRRECPTAYVETDANFRPVQRMAEAI